MFVEAHDRFANAKQDLDYVASLMLSGAVVGIVAPLLKQQGKPSMHQLLAAVSDIFAESDDVAAHEGMFRTVYNGLKHAGNNRKGVEPSQDLVLHADFRLEAAEMLEAAHEDFRRVDVDYLVRSNVSERFVALLTDSGHYIER